MDKTGKVLEGVTHLMYFFPVVLIIFGVWLFFKIRAIRAARAFQDKSVSKAIRKEITQKPLVRVAFFSSCGVMGVSVISIIAGIIMMGFGIIWGVIAIETDQAGDVFNKFANFVFNYWYALLFIAIAWVVAVIVFLVRGICVNIVYRKKLVKGI